MTITPDYTHASPSSQYAVNTGGSAATILHTDEKEHYLLNSRIVMLLVEAVMYIYYNFMYILTTRRFHGYHS